MLGLFAVVFLCSFTGLLIFAKYYDCDPVTAVSPDGTKVNDKIERKPVKLPRKAFSHKIISKAFLGSSVHFFECKTVIINPSPPCRRS